MNKQKKILTVIYLNPKTGRTKIKRRNLTRRDVKIYFRSVRPKRRKLGEFCERCGIFIGIGIFKNRKGVKVELNYINKKPNWWNIYCLCDECFYKKAFGSEESVPDLEDLERYDVDI
tara:strand:- start:5562 stop:5912 length:351 start_codon:yes stop_codon:yes gene_type:complete